MLELILGGARSGKSSLAERLASASGRKPVCIVTARADDDEMRERIEHHRQQRNPAWLLVEEPLLLAEALQDQAGDDRCIVVDCLTLWLTNLLMLEQAGSAGRLQQGVTALLACLGSLPGHVILVSNEVGQGVVPLGELSRRFVDESGRLHQAIAQISQRVTLVTAGIPQILKGDDIE
jgi:adenosylcobinamide kinase/adenosylcobinamide-phosphate guanylyltransferase